MNTVQTILSETGRKLETALAWTANQIVGTRLPLDSALRGLSIRLSGYVTYTFSSTPVAYETSIFHNLVSKVEVTVDGSRTVCAIQPHVAQMETILRGSTPVRRASAAASAAYNNNPTADSGMTYGSTTQSTTLLETLVLWFEMKMCQVGQEATWLNLRGRSSADLRLYCTTSASLDKSTNATFTATSLSFEIVTIEAQDFKMNEEWDWRRTYQIETFASQATERVIRLPAGNKVAAVSLFVIQDSSGADGTASYRKKPNNNSVTDVKFRRNGREILSTTFQTIQDQNRNRLPVNAAFASNVSRLDGYARHDFLTRGVLGTALDTSKEAGVNTFEIVLSTKASDSTYNIYPIDVAIQTDELVRIK